MPSNPPGELVMEVLPADPRGRLDKLVVALLGRAGRPASRAAVQRWIEGGSVLVDGNPARASIKVAPGARVTVREEPERLSDAAPDATVAFCVVHEDEHLLVVDKPAGLVVHPARGHETGTLVNGLVARGLVREDAADPRDPARAARPGIVHRLDKGTSGLLVVAKDGPTREALKELFAQHTIDREYVAVVCGAAQDARYETLHGRHPTDRLRFTTRVTRGRRAVTNVRVLERLGPATLVACTLATGRTHQIRVHLMERARTPILGDPLYGRPAKDPKLAALATSLGRQALHARVLGFVHPVTREKVRWESPLPEDLARVVEALRADATKSSI